MVLSYRELIVIGGVNVYFATKGRMFRSLRSNADAQKYLDNGWRIVYRDDNGVETTIGENGTWIGGKPDVEAEQKAVKQFNEKVYQMAADLDYLSMMTGIEL